ncbi:hypothetical protein [Flammeovirga pacifica]|nr:hypothetical protein [Flammeovirga pacifica]
MKSIIILFSPLLLIFGLIRNKEEKETPMDYFAQSMLNDLEHQNK